MFMYHSLINDLALQPFLSKHAVHQKWNESNIVGVTALLTFSLGLSDWKTFPLTMLIKKFWSIYNRELGTVVKI